MASGKNRKILQVKLNTLQIPHGLSAVSLSLSLSLSVYDITLNEKIIIIKMGIFTLVKFDQAYRSPCSLSWNDWNDSRKTHLVRFFFLMFFKSWWVWLSMVMELTKDFKRCMASFRVSSDMLAKQTRNQPGSVQWQEEPGEIFSLTL